MALRHTPFVCGPSATGVSSPQDGRLAMGGLLSGAGLISGGTVTGNSSGPNMQYDIAAGYFSTARGAAGTDGLYVFANDGPVTASTDENGTAAGPAPTSGTRWDLIWVRHQNGYDGGFGDANSDPQYGVTAGAAGSTPQKPYSSVPAGALVLAEASVGTSITDASHAVITMVASQVTSALPRPHELYDCDWTDVTPGASWVAGAAPDNPQARIVNGIVLWKGLIETASGNFATNSTVLLISGGNLAAKFVPPFKINRPLSANVPANDARGILNTDGSLTIITGATTGSYVDLSGFSGVYPTAGV